LSKKKEKGDAKQESAVVVVRPGDKVSLDDVDPAATAGHEKAEALEKIDKLRLRLACLQEALYAEHERSLLIVIQAMDTGGKDGAIKSLCLGLDPNGVQLTNFKYPTAEERDHDFLWRVHKVTPRKGSIGLWNRSHYEDVLVPLVHGEISRKEWRARCTDIDHFEELLGHNGVTIVKFFLHISKEEQKCRLEARLQEPDKLWKFNEGDLGERKLWDDYQRAYEDVMMSCTSAHAPWQIIPADRKWVRNLLMLEVIVATLEKMNPKYPVPEINPKEITID
jgi:PPK2 family polyphosphate:nucleotide phosphotransferase